MVSEDGGLLSAASASYEADDESHKYTRRAHPLRRALQRLLPALFAPGLPVTTRCCSSGGVFWGGGMGSHTSPRDARTAHTDLMHSHNCHDFI